jgi:hypothetical protein
MFSFSMCTVGLSGNLRRSGEMPDRKTVRLLAHSQVYFKFRMYGNFCNDKLLVYVSICLITYVCTFVMILF